MPQKKQLRPGSDVQITGKDDNKVDLTGATGWVLHFAHYSEHLPNAAVVVVGSTTVPKVGRVGGRRHTVTLDQLQVV